MKNKRRWLWLIPVAILLLPAVMVSFRLGRRTLQDRHTANFLEGATRVRVFRLDPETERPTKLAGYSVKYEGKAQGRSFASQLAAVLAPELRKQKYFSLHVKGCDPQPGVAFRVEDGSEVMDIVLCYECNLLRLIDPQQPLTERRWKDFDVQRAAMVQLAQRAFPNDARIQAMEAKPR